MIFHDRIDAGQQLAANLKYLRGQDVVVLGLPRGGIPVAYEIAKELDAPMDVIVVRKLGLPSQPELAMGAVSEDGVLVTNDEVIRLTRIRHDEFAAVETRERREVERRAKRFRGDKTAISLKGRIALLVDDGIATGSTAQAACRVARAHGAKRVLLAVPVGPADTIELLRKDADEVICLYTPKFFSAVGEWYQDFSATSDDQVAEILTLARERVPADQNSNSNLSP